MRFALPISILATALVVTAAAQTPANTADISDLRQTYFGLLSGTKTPALEDSTIFLTVVNPQQSGKFTADFGSDGSLPGKVSSTGKVSWKGKLTSGGNNAAFKFKGQLSATGRFIVGGATVKGLLQNQQINEKFIISMEADVTPTAAAAGSGLRLGR